LGITAKKANERNLQSNRRIFIQRKEILMADKVFIPQKKNSTWQDYWQKSDYRRELSLCRTDGLLPVFKKYLFKKQKLVEAGCGLGKWVIYFTQRGFDIIGVDSSRYAVKQLKKFRPQVKIKLADVRRLPFQDGEIDVYISLGVIEHFEEGPEKALKEAYRVLKPGGTAIIEVPYDNGQRIMLRILYHLKVFLKTPLRIIVEILGLRKKRKKIKWQFYEYHYSKKELDDFITRASFKIIDWFYKDDLDPKKSIGLWLDLPQLRKNQEKPDFILNKAGKRLKFLYNFFGLDWFYSACIVGVAKKPEQK
jgi:ubiquinone/menaquinone biosynthesis C-methylase UbiE